MNTPMNIKRTENKRGSKHDGRWLNNLSPVFHLPSSILRIMCLIVALLSSNIACGNIWNADPNNFHQIQTNANSGDTIFMSPGIYHPQICPITYCGVFAVIHPHGRNIIYMKDPNATGDVIISGYYLWYYTGLYFSSFTTPCQIINNEGNGCMLIGLTIRCGIEPNEDIDQLEGFGPWGLGGLICEGTRPVINRCKFIEYSYDDQPYTNGIWLQDFNSCPGIDCYNPLNPPNLEVNDCVFSGSLVPAASGLYMDIRCNTGCHIKVSDCNISNWGLAGIKSQGSYTIDVNHCNITGNLGRGVGWPNGEIVGGGGINISSQNGNISINDCNINNNQYSGIRTAGEGSLTIRRCNLTGNSTPQDGGAINNLDISATIEDSNIINNSSDANSAIYSQSWSLIMKRCRIEDNNGGGIYAVNIDANHCIIRGNRSIEGGGGIFMSGGNLFNCVISNNHAGYNGGGIYCLSNDSNIFNCTIIGNDSNGYGGGAFLEGNIRMSNCIFWGNTDSNQSIGQNQICNEDPPSSETVKFRNCDIRDTIAYGTYIHDELITNPPDCNIIGKDLGGNIDSNPLFVNDYHLGQNSLCVNAGDNNIISWDYDIDGDARILCGNVDIGVDESAFCPNECFPVTYSTDYNDWVSVGRPNCWCGQYGNPQWKSQCYGDADNKYEGSLTKYRVYSSDYQRLEAAWGKKYTQLIYDPNLICADFDHKYEGALTKYRVFTSDYARMITNWAKKETQLLPWCPIPE